MAELKISQTCVSCDLCLVFCPEKAILKLKEDYFIENFACTLCGLCISLCPQESIKLSEES